MRILILFVCFLVCLSGCFYSQSINDIGDRFWKAVSEKDYKNQIEYGPKIVEYYEHNNFPIDTAYLDFLYKLGFAYHSLQDFKNSKSVYLKSLNYSEEFWGKKDPETLKHKYLLVLNLSEIGPADEFLTLTKSCLNEFDVLFGHENDYSILMLQYLASSFELNEELDSASYYGEIQRNRTLKLHGEISDSYIYPIFNLARIYYKQKKINQAIDLYIKCIELSPLIFTKEHFTYELSLSNLGEIYMNLGDFNESIRLNEECLIIQERLNGKVNAAYAKTLNSLANCYHNIGKYEKSIDLNKECLNIRKNLFGEQHNLTWGSLNNLALNYSMIGDWESSKNINQKLLNDKLSLLGENNESFILSLSNLSVDYTGLSQYDSSIFLLKQAYFLIVKNKLQKIALHATVTQNLAFYFLNNGEIDSAEFYIKRSLITLENLHGKNSFGYMNSLSILADINQQKGLMDEAFKYYSEIHDFNILKYGDQSIIYANSLSELASFLKENGYYKDAIDSIRKAIPIYEKVHGKESLHTLRKYTILANLLLMQGELKSALDIQLEVLKIREKTIGIRHQDYITSLINVAHNYYELAEFDKARPFLIKAINIQKNNPNPYLYITSLSNYSLLLKDIGLKDSCFFYSNMALKLTRNLLGINNDDFIIRLNNLGANYLYYGDFALAMVYFDSAFVISDKLLGNDHPTTIQCYENLAATYGDIGDYEKAIDIEVECLGKIAARRGKQNLEYASGLCQLAYYDSKTGWDSLALRENKEAYEIRKEILGLRHPKTLLSALNLAVDYNALGKYNEALNILSQTLITNIELNGEEGFHTRLVYSNIGMVYLKKGDYENALNYFLKANKNDVDFPDKDAVLVNISTSYELLNNIEQSINYQIKAVNWYLEDYIKNQLFLSDFDKAKLKRKLDYYLNYLLCLNQKNAIKDPELTWYNIYISARNLINTQVKKDNVEFSILDKEELIALTYRLKDLKDKRNKAVELNNKNSLLSLEKEIEKLEIQISSTTGNTNKKQINYSMIQNKIKDQNSVFIDIIQCYKPDTDFSYYTAVVISKKSVFVIPMDNSIIYDNSLYEKYKNEATNNETKTALNTPIFYNSFWKPIADKIGDAKTIYVSLGGVYNDINLNTLYNPETEKYLLEEKDIRIVNSARDFVLSKEQEKKIYTTNTASLFGFPDFNGNTTVAVDSTDFLASTRDLNSFWLDSLTRGGLYAKPLPATKIEVENISLTLKSKGWQVNSYLAENASETNIKKQESPRILHIASHGYFFPDIPIDKDNTRFLGMDRQQVVQDPMLRSGLLFTGANRTLKGEESKGENGLLSAAEASLLDLRETELVVLSACETGKGEVKNSEGVYGLRKAFSDAGAKNIIMSLWKVDDKVTQEFMSRFYEIWLNDKTSIREAFNKTQLEIKAKYPQPYYWGAFILVGE